jgi:hypothetical protein
VLLFPNVVTFRLLLQITIPLCGSLFVVPPHDYSPTWLLHVLGPTPCLLFHILVALFVVDPILFFNKIPLALLLLFLLLTCCSLYWLFLACLLLLFIQMFLKMLFPPFMFFLQLLFRVRTNKQKPTSKVSIFGIFFHFSFDHFLNFSFSFLFLYTTL